jgi:hypothetical protein
MGSGISIENETIEIWIVIAFFLYSLCRGLVGGHHDGDESDNLGHDHLGRGSLGYDLLSFYHQFLQLIFN